MDKITTQRLAALKRQKVPIVAVTAYDYPTAAIVDAAGVDLVLVGDSLSNVILGNETTLPVTLEEMMFALRAVRRGIRRALLVADLPFGYCHAGPSSRALEASIQFLKAGAEAVKLEGGKSRAALVRSLVDASIPVIGHIGLMPQSIHALGGYRVQGKTVPAAEALLEDAIALQNAGASAIVLEGMPREVGAHITDRLQIPTIGIGAGEGCDGQILVLTDLLGLTVPPPPEGPAVIEGRKPRYVREYLQLRNLIADAVERYGADVRSGQFPGASEAYRLSEAETAAPVQNKS